MVLVQYDAPAGAEFNGQVADDFDRLHTGRPDRQVQIVRFIVVVDLVGFDLDDVRVRDDFDVIVIEPSFDVGTEPCRIHRQDAVAAVEKFDVEVFACLAQLTGHFDARM